MKSCEGLEVSSDAAKPSLVASEDSVAVEAWFEGEVVDVGEGVGL